jgi:hypothetical protein
MTLLGGITQFIIYCRRKNEKSIYTLTKVMAALSLLCVFSVSDVARADETDPSSIKTQEIIDRLEALNGVRPIWDRGASVIKLHKHVVKKHKMSLYGNQSSRGF